MILAIDVGTTTCKGAWFADDGSVAAMHSVALRMHSGVSGSHLCEPSEWSSALAALCRREPLLTSRVRAIAVSGNGPTVVPVEGVPEDVDGIVHAKAGSALLWMDRRAVAESAEVSAVVGSFVDAGFFLPKVLYLKHQQSEVYNRSRHFLASFEYINYLLTGEAVSVLHAADSLRWYWTGPWLEALGLDERKFPPLCKPGDQVGSVSLLAASCLGLPRGVPVYAGGPDFYMSILGSGAVRPGDVCDRGGTSEGINLCALKACNDSRIMTYLHPVSPYYNISGIISTSGKAIAWARDLVAGSDCTYADLYRLMATATPGCSGLLFLPYLAGERAPIWDPDARGMFSGLNLAVGKAELLRSVAEGVCLAIHDVLEVIEECGGAVQHLRVTGGPAESEFLNQLKADVTGKPVLVPLVHDAELTGAMIVARTALGDFDSLAKASDALVAIDRVYESNQEYRDLYNDMLARYRALYRVSQAAREGSLQRGG